MTPDQTHIHHPANDVGLALVTVLAVVAILLAAALELARETGHLAMVSSNDADRIIAVERAMTGIHLAMALLAEDARTTDIDSIQENWAQPEVLADAVAALGIAEGSLEIGIQDELGKLPINALIKKYPGSELNPRVFEVLEAFFLQLTKDPVPLLNAIQDWLDSKDDDAVTGLSGAESDYYLSLEPPYTCNNGPFTHISELFLVKDITPALFAPESTDDEIKDGKTADPIIPADIFTVHGTDQAKSKNHPSSAGYGSFSPKVNINTAPQRVIASLLPASQKELAQDLIAYREKKTDDGTYVNALDKGWPEQVIGMSPKEKKAFAAVIRYDTDVFRIKSQAKKGMIKTTIYAWVRRNKHPKTGNWSCRILQLAKDN